MIVRMQRFDLHVDEAAYEARFGVKPQVHAQQDDGEPLDLNLHELLAESGIISVTGVSFGHDEILD